MTSIHHPNGSKPRPIGKYVSVSDAARKLGVTRQEAKRILEPKRSGFHSDQSCDTMRHSDRPAWAR